MAEKEVYSFSDFLAAHQSQLVASAVPPELWGSLYKKLMTETFDAGDSFRMLCEQDESGRSQWSVQAVKDLHPVDEDCVFLIDHAWTFRPHQARQQLEQVPNLAERLQAIMELEDDDSESSEAGSEDEVTSVQEELQKSAAAKLTRQDGDLPRDESIEANLCQQAVESNSVVDRILERMWSYVNTYTVRFKDTVDEEGMPVWYVMDEFGSRIPHSDEPNARIVPLFFVPHGIAYNILFLLKPVGADEEIRRDFVDNSLSLKHPDWRSLLLLPWQANNDLDLSKFPKNAPMDDFFLSGRAADELPSENDQADCKFSRENGRVLRIYADDTQLVKHLKISNELVDDWKKADVLWLMKHFHQFRELCTQNPTALVNQFPSEGCLTVKDLLSAVVSQNSPVRGYPWFQHTFNLDYQLPQFIAEFKDRQEKGLDNTWIVKPWNLARGMDMHVSNQLGHIIRLLESGPKIVCKYIEQPLLFPRPDNGNAVKFDLRYIVFVTQFKPLKAYIFNKFWIRFAIKNFSLSQLDDNETHFTVFNYADKGKILQMTCEKFVEHIETAYNWFSWSEIQGDVNSVLREALEVVSNNPPPRGVAPNAQSRAMYGVDVMLRRGTGPDERFIQPVLLECNFMPDCTRACDYYPDFADTVFNTLFMENIDTSKVTPL